MRIIPAVAFCLLISAPVCANAEFDWAAATLDNDLFVGSDDGYTNGLYVSLFEVNESELNPPTRPDFWVYPLLWSMPSAGALGAVNAYTIGQTMSTPSDITIANPADDDLPYSALLAMTNSYVVANPVYADRASTTVGIVGPSALGEEAQKFVHQLIGSDEPLGWGTQLKDELVFQFSRARVWRKWVSETAHSDVLTSFDLSVGTIQSAVSAGFAFRYGRGLADSYATTLFNSTRAANPGALDGGWYAIR
ncbi:MAG: lipid A deacylase LpxR family protein [Pseudomonadota bacterium]